MSVLQQRRTPERSVFPSPRDGATLGINPDGFIWVPEPEADWYELTVTNESSGKVACHNYLTDHYYVPTQPFTPGEYTWQLTAYTETGDELGRRQPWNFTVPETVKTVVPPTGSEILAAIPDTHPKLTFPANALPEIRERVTTTQSEDLALLESIVEEAYEEGLPDLPTFHSRETLAEQRQAYKDYFHHIRDHVDYNLRASSLYYLLTGDEKAGEYARKMIRHVCGFTPDGPNSLEVNPPDIDWYWGDEAGLSYARILAECYDWTYDRFDDAECLFIERNLRHRCRRTYERLQNQSFFTTPTSSHNARLPAFLGQMAILLEDRLDPGEAEMMLDYVMDVFWTFYPHWGGSEGGWAEGPQYGNAYTTMWYPSFFATIERQTGCSIWDRPFYQDIGNFFLYCAPPNAEDLPFGDAHENPAGAGVKRVFELYGAVTEDPGLLERADRIDAEYTGSEFHYHRFLYPPQNERKPPKNRPDCRAFSDVGWAAFHSELANPERDNYLVFRSSPYGNVSHSHNNQNAFAIASGGHSLAISSGYYPQYGFPHHAEWTRRTKAHNCIEIDGTGQERGVTATGQLNSFDTEPPYAYCSGAAENAYSPAVKRFHRHVLFVKPGLFVIADDLETTDSDRYDWWLHSHEAPDIGRETNTITIDRGPARLELSLFADAPIDWSDSVGFDPAVADGFADELDGEYPDQHHMTATTAGEKSRSYVAVCQVGQPGNDTGPTLPSVTTESRPGAIEIRSDSFTGQVTFDDRVSISGEVLSETDRYQIEKP